MSKSYSLYILERGVLRDHDDSGYDCDKTHYTELGVYHRLANAHHEVGRLIYKPLPDVVWKVDDTDTDTNGIESCWRYDTKLETWFIRIRKVTSLD